MKKYLAFGTGAAAFAVLPFIFLACSSDNSGNNGAGGAAGMAGLGGGAGAGATGGMMAAGGMPGSGGMQQGGATAAGGTTGTGGAATGGMGGDLSEMALRVCQSREPQDPGGPGAMGEMCCGGKGTCGPMPMGSTASSLGHETCGTSLVCVPTAATLGDANNFKTCTTKSLTSDPAGLEGRCIPKCFLLGNAQLPTLDDGGGTCGTDEFCAPCFSPIDGQATGACSLKTGDAPMNTTPPTPYVTCPQSTGGMGGMGGGGGAGGDGGANGNGGTAGAAGGSGGATGGTAGAGGDGGATGGAAGAAGAAGSGGSGIPQGGGLCVPETALAKLTDSTNKYYNPSIPNLRQDNCAQGEKCVPEDKVKDPGHCYDKCTTSNNTQLLGSNDPSYSYGACTPPYVIYDVAGTTGIQVSTGGGPCPGDLLCAPCRDPLHMGNPSGACY